VGLDDGRIGTERFGGGDQCQAFLQPAFAAGVVGVKEPADGLRPGALQPLERRPLFEKGAGEGRVEFSAEERDRLGKKVFQVRFPSVGECDLPVDQVAAGFAQLGESGGCRPDRVSKRGRGRNV